MEPAPAPAPAPAAQDDGFTAPEEVTIPAATLPAGWHAFPADPPKGKAGSLVIVRRKPADGPVRLEFLEWGKVVVAVPGAIVEGRAFTRGDNQPVADVEAWRAIPGSWLK